MCIWPEGNGQVFEEVIDDLQEAQESQHLVEIHSSFSWCCCCFFHSLFSFSVFRVHVPSLSHLHSLRKCLIPVILNLLSCFHHVPRDSTLASGISDISNQPSHFSRTTASHINTMRCFSTWKYSMNLDSGSCSQMMPTWKLILESIMTNFEYLSLL